MRKVYCVLIVSMLIVVSVGCKRKQEVMSKNLDVHFEFVMELDEDKYPHTTAYLIVDAKQTMTLKVGEYVADFNQGVLEEDTEWSTQPNALCNYMGWYKGQGVILSLIEDGSQLVVKQKLIEEQSDNSEPVTVVSSVIMDKDVSVTVKEAVHKQKKGEEVPMTLIEPAIAIIPYKDEISRLDNWLDSTEKVSSNEIAIERESTERGAIEPYYDKGELRFFRVTHYGEMGRTSKMYYLLKSGAVFVEVTEWYYEAPLVSEKADRQEQFYIVVENKVYTTDRQIKTLDESDDIEIIKDYSKYMDMIKVGQ